MSLPSNFGLLALAPTIRENAAFLFLQTGVNGYIDVFIQSATGSPVNILTITSGVNVANTVYVNEYGNDTTGQRGSVTLPFATIEAAKNAASFGDTIEVFPGSYVVTGNMYQNTVNYYFHEGSSVELQQSGRIEVDDLSFGVSFRGYLNLTYNGVYEYPIYLKGETSVLEFTSLNCGTGKIKISDSATACIRGINPDQIVGSLIDSPLLIMSGVSDVKFENINFATEIVADNPAGFDSVIFSKCTFAGNQTPTQPAPFALTGKFLIEDCSFDTYLRLLSVNGEYSEVKNSEFRGGIITSGVNYFENCVFNTRNYNAFPSYSLISNLGGTGVFANCYARNFNNTNYVNYTFNPSGSVSGSVNFNIANSFTSFKPNQTNTVVKYGTFAYNSTLV